jgi:hypothetical protein
MVALMAPLAFYDGNRTISSSIQQHEEFVMLVQITSFAEVIGAIGVILSLLYVGKQLKQTNAMSRSAARQALSAELNDWAMAIASSPSLAESLAKVHFQELVRSDATDVERIQIGYAFVGFVGQMHLAYEQTKEGILTEKELSDLHGPSRGLMRQRYLSSVWPILRHTYPEDFCGWLERRYNLAVRDENGSAAS